RQKDELVQPIDKQRDRVSRLELDLLGLRRIRRFALTTEHQLAERTPGLDEELLVRPGGQLEPHFTGMLLERVAQFVTSSRRVATQPPLAQAPLARPCTEARSRWRQPSRAFVVTSSSF